MSILHNYILNKICPGLEDIRYTKDDNEAMERVQAAISAVPEMEWLDFSRGFGTDRETAGPDGVVTGNVTDETAVRGSYFRWKELMNRDVQLKVV